MTRFRALLALVLMLVTAALSAQAVDPREQSYQFFVDGVVTAGIVGYQLNFNHSIVSRTDSRHLDTAFSADQRLISVNVTQKGLNRLQDILNSATSTGAPGTHALALVVRTADGTILAPVGVHQCGSDDHHLAGDGGGDRGGRARQLPLRHDVANSGKARLRRPGAA